MFAAGLRDLTQPSYQLIVHPVVGAEAERVLTYPAYWGIHNEVSLVLPTGRVGGPKGTVAAPEGPTSPGSKALYQDPVRTIFCAATWRYQGPGSAPRSHCG